MPRILLVEDDSGFCYAARRALEQAGYEVAAFESTLLAWDHVGRQARFDLLIVDIIFPAGQPSGMALARNATQHRPGLPVVFITGVEEAFSAARTEATYVLRKPLELKELVATVEHAFAEARQQS